MSTPVLRRSRTLGGSGRETAEEFCVPQSLAQLLQGPRGLAGRTQSQTWRGCKRGLPELCTMPPQSWLSGVHRELPARHLQAQFRGNAGLRRDPSVGVALAHCGPHAVLGAPGLEPCLSWPEAPVLYIVGRGCLGTPTCRVGGCPGSPAPLCPEYSSSSTASSSSAFKQQAGLQVQGQTHPRQVCDYGL